jgi:hypothetical protein
MIVDIPIRLFLHARASASYYELPPKSGKLVPRERVFVKVPKQVQVFQQSSLAVHLIRYIYCVICEYKSETAS